jgi:ribonuclease G
MRDLFSDDYDRVLIDDPKLYRNIKSYIQAIAPQMVDAVQPHKSKKHIFEQTNIQGEIEEAFSGRVNLPTGGYLFIEHTEAMHVVDVNSGRSGRGMSQEENSLRVNLEAARAIAKQVRLRDLGGIIVIDFIDLRDERNKRKVFEEMKREFKKDRAVSKILPMSDFGLIQITRQRLRPSITVGQSPDSLSKNGSPSPSAAKEPRPKGPSKDATAVERTDKSGDSAPANDERGETHPPRRQSRPTSTRKVDPAEILAHMEQWLVDYKTMGNRRAVTLRVHPFTAAYLNRKVPNHPTRWFMKHLIRVRLEIDDAVSPQSYRFMDARSGDDLTDKIELPASE